MYGNLPYTSIFWSPHNRVTVGQGFTNTPPDRRACPRLHWSAPILDEPSRALVGTGRKAVRRPRKRTLNASATS
jgi:hypothetical protein